MVTLGTPRTDTRYAVRSQKDSPGLGLEECHRCDRIGRCGLNVVLLRGLNLLDAECAGLGSRQLPGDSDSTAVTTRGQPTVRPLWN